MRGRRCLGLEAAKQLGAAGMTLPEPVREALLPEHALEGLLDLMDSRWPGYTNGKKCIRDCFAMLVAERDALAQRCAAADRDAGRLDYIERTFSGMTNRERYLPVTMIWGKGCNGRTLREACDKYMKRDAALNQETRHAD
jgi:hypothetical protein